MDFGPPPRAVYSYSALITSLQVRSYYLQLLCLAYVGPRGVLGRAERTGICTLGPSTSSIVHFFPKNIFSRSFSTPSHICLDIAWTLAWTKMKGESRCSADRDSRSESARHCKELPRPHVILPDRPYFTSLLPESPLCWSAWVFLHAKIEILISSYCESCDFTLRLQRWPRTFQQAIPNFMASCPKAWSYTPRPHPPTQVAFQPLLHFSTRCEAKLGGDGSACCPGHNVAEASRQRETSVALSRDWHHYEIMT